MIADEDATAIGVRGGGLRSISEIVDRTLNRIICRVIGRKVREAMDREAMQAGWPGFKP